MDPGSTPSACANLSCSLARTSSASYDLQRRRERPAATPAATTPTTAANPSSFQIRIASTLRTEITRRVSRPGGDGSGFRRVAEQDGAVEGLRPGPSPLRLRPLQADDEEAFVGAHEAMVAEGFMFGLGYEPGLAWSQYVARLERSRCGLDLPDGYVAATFLVADVGGEIVGRTSIRHELNEYLLQEGGHIGYGVLAPYRRQGYATETLRQSLVIARAVGVDQVLVTCDDDNVGSSTVIERCGGVLDSVVARADGGALRRYWIDERRGR